ncbi:hypothetical protein AGLY_003315 [Aphis glycines]|uniref:Uncharacterized protein n=1 Tax=Aphis glycines TaxID=307491 RepID=A0A6G0U066_APHGL|nr:hypothetical protein AGLY_003315 [Aphis glycines]
MGQIKEYWYKPIPVKEFCHVDCPTAVFKQVFPESLPPDLQEEVFKSLFQAGFYKKGFPDSAISIHLQGRHSHRINTLQDTVIPGYDKNNFYVNLVTAHNLIISDEQNNISELIKNIHQLINYLLSGELQNKNINLKLKSLFFSKFCGNSATKYGVENEPLAIKSFEKLKN